MIYSGKFQELPTTYLNLHETFRGHSGDFNVTFKTHSDKKMLLLDYTYILVYLYLNKTRWYPMVPTIKVTGTS